MEWCSKVFPCPSRSSWWSPGTLNEKSEGCGWAKKENPFPKRDVVSGCHQKKKTWQPTTETWLKVDGVPIATSEACFWIGVSPERCVPLTKPPAVSGVVTSNFENIRQRWYFPVKNHSCLMCFDLRAKISPNDSGFMNFSHQFHSKSLQILTLKCLLLVTCVVYRPCEQDSHCASDALSFMHIVIPYSMQYFERRVVVATNQECKQQDHFHRTSKLGRMAFWIIYFPSWRLEIFLLKCPSVLKLAIHWLLVKNKTFLDSGLFETPPRSVSSLSSQLATVTNCTIWVNSAILMSPSFVKCYINVTMQQYLSFPKTSPVASGNKFAF